MTSIKPDDQPITDEDLKWFNCRWNASLLEEMNLREIALIFKEGLQSHYSLESLQFTLDTVFTDAIEQLALEIADTTVRIKVAEYVGARAVKQELQEQLDRLLGLDRPEHY